MLSSTDVPSFATLHHVQMEQRAGEVRIENAPSNGEDEEEEQGEEQDEGQDDGQSEEEDQEETAGSREGSTGAWSRDHRRGS